MASPCFRTARTVWGRLEKTIECSSNGSSTWGLSGARRSRMATSPGTGRRYGMAKTFTPNCRARVASESMSPSVCTPSERMTARRR